MFWLCDHCNEIKNTKRNARCIKCGYVKWTFRSATDPHAHDPSKRTKMNRTQARALGIK